MSKARSSSRVLLSSIALAAVLSSGGLAGQERGRVLPIAAPLETGPENAIIISNLSTNSILRVTDLSETGVQRGPTAGGLSFNAPKHFSLDASRRIYLADVANRRIVRMDDVAGTNWIAFSEGGGNVISQPGEDVASTMVDGAERIYITGSSRIGLVRIDNMSGAGWISLRVASGGAKGVAMDGQGRIYVVDTGNGRIVRVNDMQGSGLVAYGTIGYGVGQFNRPEMVALDSAGRIYITDNENNRIVRINDMSGGGWTSIGSYGTGADQFYGPHDVKIDTANRIWIADTGNSRIVRINSMAGDGWVTFGAQELQGRELGISGNKGIQVIGLGPALIYPAILPRLSTGGGFSTTIVAINTRPEGVDTEVALRNGAQMGGCGQQALNCSVPFLVTVDGVSASSFTQRVAPMGTSRFEVTSATATPNSYARLTSTDDVDTVALLRTHRGTVVASEAGVRLSPPTDHFTVFIDHTNGAATGYTVVNGASQGPGVLLLGAARLTLNLRDKTGRVVDVRSIPVGPGQSFTELASAGFVGAGPGFEGSVEMITNGKLVEAVSLRYDNAAADVFTSMPVMLHRETAPVENFPGQSPTTPPPAATTTLHYPHIGDGGTYRTNFILANLTDASTTATVEFFASDGTPLSMPIGGAQRTRHTVSLSGRAVDQFTTDGTASGISWGWARVTGAGTFGGSAIVQTVVAGRIVSEAGVPSSAPAAHFTTYVDNRGSTQSGIAVSNPNNASVGILIHLRDASGNVVSSAERTIPALGHLSQFFTQIFAGFSEFEGTMELQTGGPMLTGVGIRYDNADGAVFTTTPVTKLP